MAQKGASAATKAQATAPLIEDFLLVHTVLGFSKRQVKLYADCITIKKKGLGKVVRGTYPLSSSCTVSDSDKTSFCIKIRDPINDCDLYIAAEQVGWKEAWMTALKGAISRLRSSHNVSSSGMITLDSESPYFTTDLGTKERRSSLGIERGKSQLTIKFMEVRNLLERVRDSEDGVQENETHVI